MAAKTSTARKRTAARRRKTAPRGRSAAAARRVKIPRTGPIHARLGAWMALRIVTRFADHHDVIRSRKDAAILRATHQGCPTCKGNGQIYTKDKKTGAFTGAKRCPAKATKEKVSRWEINRAARMGADKRTGLVGWSCPCGKKEKPRYRDAKEATKALRAHEKHKHGGKTVGGTWYAQATEGAIQAMPEKKAAPKRKPAPTKGPTVASKTVSLPNAPYNPNDPAQEHRRGPVSSDPNARNPHSGLTDAEWVAQGYDRPLQPGECKICRGTTLVPVINANAATDYDRQRIIQCTRCVAGRVKS